MLPDDKQQSFLDGQGERCPWCESHEIEGGPVEVLPSMALQEVSCINCDASWKAEYHLTAAVEFEPGREEMEVSYG